MADKVTNLGDYRWKKAAQDLEASDSEGATFYPDRLISARIIHRLSEAKLAERSGVDRASIALFESGMLAPDKDQLQALALVLNFPPQWFYTEPVKGWPSIEQTSLRFH